jgi:hypothetical protein
MIFQTFDWDTVQMPITLLDAHYRSFQSNVLLSETQTLGSDDKLEPWKTTDYGGRHHRDQRKLTKQLCSLNKVGFAGVFLPTKRLPSV